MALETLVFSQFNHLTPLVAQKSFILISCREIFGQYGYTKVFLVF
jgi:hypothetical protein